MSKRDETMKMIEMLAGAAQAGAKGEIALAALEIMEAAEAVRAVMVSHEHSEMIESSLESLLDSAKNKIADMMRHPALMEKAMQDIAEARGRSFKY